MKHKTLFDLVNLYMAERRYQYVEAITRKYGLKCLELDRTVCMPADLEEDSKFA